MKLILKMYAYDCFLIDTNTYQCTILVNDIYVGKCIFVVESTGWIERLNGWIERLEIESRYRNRGYGSLLMEYVETFMRRLDCRKIGLVTMPDEDSMERSELQKFYRKRGFECVGYNSETLQGSNEMVKLL